MGKIGEGAKEVQTAYYKISHGKYSIGNTVNHTVISLSGDRW